MNFFQACFVLLIFTHEALCDDDLEGDEVSDLEGVEFTKVNKDVFKGKKWMRRTKTIDEGKKAAVLERMKTLRKKMNVKADGTIGIGVRIIKGRLANKGEFPYQVAVIADNDEICGGSLITNSHVLTAAHCVYGRKDIELIFASLNQATPDEGSVSIKTSKYVYHESYDNNSLANDIALVYMPKPIKETTLIKKVQLPTRLQASKIAQPGNWATIAGWGRTSDKSEGVSDTLKTVDLKVLEGSECVSAYGEENILSSNVCAFGNNGDSTCQGDSGGPLVQNMDGQLIQIGLVSFGAGEGCETGFPEVYTRVSSYTNWIYQKTKPPPVKQTKVKKKQKNSKGNKGKKQSKKTKSPKSLKIVLASP